MSAFEKVPKTTTLKVTRFIEFLKLAHAKDPIKFSHVVFYVGTCVRLDKVKSEFKGFTNDHIEDFPVHRLVDDNLKEVVSNNTLVWKSYQNHPMKTEINKAYHLLINDGYPYPGGQGSDRSGYPMHDKLWCIFFEHRTTEIQNLVVDEDIKTLSSYSAAAVGGNYRRTDYMFPQVYCTIGPGPDFKVTNFTLVEILDETLFDKMSKVSNGKNLKT